MNSKKDKNSITTVSRDYSLNIPQLLAGGISENWLQKELGDVHWSMISESLDTKSNEIIDSNGERLYASFVRLQWNANESLFSFKENDTIKIDGEISLYGNKMFFSNDRIVCGNKYITASLMSVFSSRKSGNNQKLEKGKPLNSETAKLKKHKELPNLAKGFFDLKTFLFSDSGEKQEKSNIHEFYNTQFPIQSEPIFTKRYHVDPYDDINGVGLLYFASYSKINDKCERFYFQNRILNNEDEEKQNWAESSYCIARDIHFYGNANANEELLYSLEDCKFIDTKNIQLSSSLRRTKDGQLIAKIFTVKQLISGIKIDLHGQQTTKDDTVLSIPKPQTKISAITSTKKKHIQNKTLEVTNNNGAKISYNRKQLNKIIIDFLNRMFDSININATTDLRQVGIESITLTELSEYLNVNYYLSSNPSKFFGFYTIDAITSHLLGSRILDIETIGEEKNVIPLLPKKTDDIAIIGTSFRIPGASTREEFWANLINDVSSITTTPEDRWKWPDWVDVDDTHKGINRGGYIRDIDKFDAKFFGILPVEAELMDPQQRILLELTWELLEDSGYKPSDLKGSKTGVYIAASGSDYELLIQEKKIRKTLSGTGTSLALLANRISYYYDFDGPSVQIDTACSSSLVAINEAVKAIQNGECDQVVVGGIHLMCHPSKTLAYYQANMLSVDGKCQTFDEKANGYVRGEGGVVMLLKSVSQAERDGDSILGIIKSTAINHGGKSGGLTVPNPFKQQKLLEEVYQKSAIDFSTVSYVEAHGTATSLGDPVEVTGLTNAFNKNVKIASDQKTWCGLGSVKSNVGHLEAAAGMVGVLKVLLAMEKRYLPKTINFEKLNPKIELKNTPFYIQDTLIPWTPEQPNKPLRAGISSFGIGGTNGHIVLESYSRQPEDLEKSSKEPQVQQELVVIVLSARNEEQLRSQVIRLNTYIEEFRDSTIYDIAYTLHNRVAMEERLAFVVKSTEQLNELLKSYLISRRNKAIDIFSGNAKKEKLNFLMHEASGKMYINTVLKNKEVTSLAQLWVVGIEINWDVLYNENPKPKRLNLPTYPFADRRYWVTESNEIEECSSKKTRTKVASSIQENKSFNTSPTHDIQNHDTNAAKKEQPMQEKERLHTIESLLIKLLVTYLKIEEKDIDLTIDIADYGLDSIISSLIISKLKETFPEVPRMLFFEHQTFEEVIMYLATNSLDDLSKLTAFSGQDLEQSSFLNRDTDISVIAKNETEDRELGTVTHPEIDLLESSEGIYNDVAIIGIGGIFPQSKNVKEFMNHLELENVITEQIPKKRLELLGLRPEEHEKIKTFYGGFLDGIESFDYKKFKISYEEAIQIDPQLRKLIETVWAAIYDSGYTLKKFQKNETGVFVATRGNSGYKDIMHTIGKGYETEVPAIYANRLSHIFNLKGPSEIIDTACSSFIAAIDRACSAFERGDCKQAVVGTATLNLSYNDMVSEDLTGIYSKQKVTKSFGQDADGFVRSETIGAIILKPLKEAKKDGDSIHGVIKGVGVYHGGKAPLKWNSPNIKGQKKAIENAIKRSSIDPLTVSYIEAEANGVTFVDSSEMVAIQSVYGDYFKQSSKDILNNEIAIGSMKPLLGHTENSSTFPCLLKLILSSRKKILYGVKDLKTINDAINVKEHFSILKESRPESKSDDNPMRMAINCLGLGGVNTHLIFENYEDTITTPIEATQVYSFIFSDESESQLYQMMQQFLTDLPQMNIETPEQELLTRMAYTLQVGREQLACRLAFTAKNSEEIQTKIQQWITYIDSSLEYDDIYYNSGKIDVITNQELEKILDQNNRELLLKYWVGGAVIAWEDTPDFVKSKRMSLPSNTLKSTHCWPFKTSVINPSEPSKSRDSLSLSNSFFKEIENQVSAPYNIGCDSLVLFDLKWKKKIIDIKKMEEEVNDHQVIVYGFKGIKNQKAKIGSPKITVLPELKNDISEAFIKLAQDLLLYIQNLIKQKPKKTIFLQIVLPISNMDLYYGITGLIHTCNEESVRIKSQLLFLDETIEQKELIKLVSENLTTVGKDLIVKYHRNTRFVEYTKALNLSTSSIDFKQTYRKGEVILITGGLGGLGVLVAKDIIVHAEAVTIVLTGRSQLDEKREQLLSDLNQSSNKVVYYPSDISKSEDVEYLIQQIKKDHGALNGIIHCAGVTRDNYIIKKAQEEVRAVLEPKVHGVVLLDKFTKTIPLRFFLCFSSLHSLGNAGQADYAMGNAYLDGFVRHRNTVVMNNGSYGKSLSINWPHWKDGGMQLSEIGLELMKSTRGSTSLPSVIGLSLLHYVLQRNTEQLIIDFGDCDKIIKQHSIHLEHTVVNSNN